MAEAAGADSGTAVGIGRDVDDVVVGTRGIAGDSTDTRQVVQTEVVADTPGDGVVGAGGVTADPDSANDFLAGSVECQTSAEHVDAADLVADHRILGGAVVRWWS